LPAVRSRKTPKMETEADKCTDFSKINSTKKLSWGRGFPKLWGLRRIPVERGKLRKVSRKCENFRCGQSRSYEGFERPGEQRFNGKESLVDEITKRVKQATGMICGKKSSGSGEKVEQNVRVERDKTTRTSRICDTFQRGKKCRSGKAVMQVTFWDSTGSSPGGAIAHRYGEGKTLLQEDGPLRENSCQRGGG